MDENTSALAQEEAGPEVVTPVEGVEPETAAEAETPEIAEEERSERAKRRNREKAAKQRVVEERNEALAKIAELEARRQKVLDAAKAEKEPTEADYPDPFDLQTAKMLWGVERKLTQREVKQVDEAADAVKSQVESLNQQESAVIAEAWAAQVADAKTRYADFEKVAHFAPISEDVAKLVATSDLGADVAYYLGQNHAVAKAISTMPLVEAARELGRIEARLTLPKPKTQTNAPDPISPVGGKGGASRDPAKMSVAEWAAYRAGGGTV
jgi:hypothetical protein